MPLQVPTSVARICQWRGYITWALCILIYEGWSKKFSAWPSSVQKKIKTVFASYSRKAQKMKCTIWLLGQKSNCARCVILFWTELG